MQVTMYPGKVASDNNQFIHLLAQGLQTLGAAVDDWNHYYSLGRADIFHVHWPERIAYVRRRPYEKLRGNVMAANFFRTIDRIRRKGGRLVWTVHNLAPHDETLRNDPFLYTFMDRFLPLVDLCVSLTRSGSNRS